MRADSTWFREARWGTFMHFLAAPASSMGAGRFDADEWNRRVDAFQVKALAQQLGRCGSRYFFITLGQNSGHYCSPNAYYDHVVGRHPSLLSKRDLVADLIAELDARGIRLMVYLPSHAPAFDQEAIKNLGCTPSWDCGAWSIPKGQYTEEQARRVDDRLSVFQRHWEMIIREWSMRWGNHVHGWWIDGCYFSDKMYAHPDAPNFVSFANAMKAGNPQSLVAFNTGVKVPIPSATEHEDYTAGEIANAFPVNMDSRSGQADKPDTYWGEPLKSRVGKAQLHALTFQGEYWGRGRPRFPDALVSGYTQHVNSVGGVMTWDVPVLENGTILPEAVEQLCALRKATDR